MNTELVFVTRLGMEPEEADRHLRLRREVSLGSNNCARTYRATEKLPTC
jgi:hypothetical protein